MNTVTIKVYMLQGLGNDGPLIGASLSKPHTSESNGGFFIYIYISAVRTSFRKFKLNSFNPKHCARRSVRRNISKRTHGQRIQYLNPRV